MLRNGFVSLLNFVLPEAPAQELPPEPPRLRPRRTIQKDSPPPKTSIESALANSSNPLQESPSTEIEEKESTPITPKHLHSFDKLKSKEFHLEEASKRIPTEYSRNITAALELSEITDEKDYILEHAARRVDLFFYTLIAYYKSNCLPVQGITKFQHGIGTVSTHACHSSFFPALIDKSIDKKEAMRLKGGKNDIIKKSILCGKHFMDSLNATVELPKYANNLDCELEGKINNPSLCRKRALDIIRHVSIGNIDPVQGLERFLKVMNITFINLKEGGYRNTKPYIQRITPNVSKVIKKKLIDFATTGTLTSKLNMDNNTVNSDYVELLLRLTPEEKIQCKKDSDSKNEVYQRKFAEIKDEILNTKSEYLVKARKMKK